MAATDGWGAACIAASRPPLRRGSQRALGGGAAGQGVAAATAACQDGGFGAGDEPVGGLPAGADFDAGTAAHFAEPTCTVRAIGSGRRSINWPAQLCAPAPPTAHRRRPSSQRSSQRSGSSLRPRQQQPGPRRLRMPQQRHPRQHQTRLRQRRVPQQPRPRQHQMCPRNLRVPQRTLAGTSRSCSCSRVPRRAFDRWCELERRASADTWTTRKGYGGRGDTRVERWARGFVRQCRWSHVQSTTQGARPSGRCAPTGRGAPRRTLWTSTGDCSATSRPACRRQRGGMGAVWQGWGLGVGALTRRAD